MYCKFRTTSGVIRLEEGDGTERERCKDLVNNHRSYLTMGVILYLMICVFGVLSDADPACLKYSVTVY